jgi:hypothetical protein
MVGDRIPRRVEVDWSRRRDTRIPIIDSSNFDFGEPGFVDRAGKPVEGMICWDPSFGWVLDVPEAALAEALRRHES